MKTVLALVVVALTRGWHTPLPRWMPLLGVWGAGVVLTGYALVQIVSLSMGGLILNDGEELPKAFWAYLLLWAPLWLAIGVTLLLTAWRATDHSEHATA